MSGIKLVKKFVTMRNAYPTSLYLSRSNAVYLYCWSIAEPTAVMFGRNNKTAISVEWGGTDIVYPVFVTEDGMRIAVADCGFEYVDCEGKIKRHIARE